MLGLLVADKESIEKSDQTAPISKASDVRFRNRRHIWASTQDFDTHCIYTDA